MGLKWRRTFACSICGGEVFYNEDTFWLWCNCCVTHKQKPLPQWVLDKCFELVQ